MEIKFNTNIIMGVPVSECPIPPADQPGSIKVKCPVCKEDMWASDKKRAAQAYGKGVIYCIICVIKAQIKDAYAKGQTEITKLETRDIDTI